MIATDVSHARARMRRSATANADCTETPKRSLSIA
jgi:hypothetical protein